MAHYHRFTLFDRSVMGCKCWIITFLIHLPSLMKWHVRLLQLNGSIFYYLIPPLQRSTCTLVFLVIFLLLRIFQIGIIVLYFIFFWKKLWFVFSNTQYKVYIVLKEQEVLPEQNQTGFPRLMMAIKQNPYFPRSFSWKSQINAAVLYVNCSGLQVIPAFTVV